MRIKKTVFAAALIIAVFPFLCGFSGGGKAYAAGPSPVEEDIARVPVIMYHNIRKANHGKFVISPKEFENDLNFLSGEGYNTVTVSDLTAFVERGVLLPSKPVMLTFDDGNYGVYKYAFPLLTKYGMKAVISVIGCYTDKYSEEGRTDINYPNLTWTQINEMKDSRAAEFQNHSYNLHFGSGACERSSEAPGTYEERLKSDLEHMQRRMKEMTGEAATAFTYPFGRLSKKTELIIKHMGFKASFTCFEGVNKITKGNSDCLFGLKRFNRPHGKALSAILRS